MIETTIMLKPESEWRPGMTPDKLISELNQAIQFPGLTNAWTMPIKTRIDMLSTGIKTPVGIKLSGPDLTILQELGREVEAVIRQVPGTLSVYAERVMGGNYLNFNIQREALARYGLTVGDVQDVIQSAIGGMNITTTVEGLERYPVNLRYSRELRHNLPALREILVPTPTGTADSHGTARRHRDYKGTTSYQERELPAECLDLCGHHRYRCRDLRQDGPESGGRARRRFPPDTTSHGAGSTST